MFSQEKLYCVFDPRKIKHITLGSGMIMVALVGVGYSFCANNTFQPVAVMLPKQKNGAVSHKFFFKIYIFLVYSVLMKL